MLEAELRGAVSDRDIVIVGGGLVGHSMAIALSGLGFKLAILDNKIKPSAPIAPLSEGPSKALALSLATQRFLQTVGIWADIQHKISPISAVHVSEQGRFGRTLIEASKHSLPALGFVVDSLELEHHLCTKVATLPDVALLHGATVKDYRALNVPLVIAADGTHSRIRDNAGITTKVHDYQQTAIVANLSVKHPVNGVAYERFTQVGPIALLPLGDKKVKCVWVVSGAEKAQALCALPEKAFIEALGHAFGHRLGPVLSLGLRNTYPLVSRVADTLYANGLVLMGNAAATLHPIAAQGFNLAVRDIATLAEALWHAKLGGQSLDDVRILQSYAHSRMPDRNAVIGLTHGLSSSFEITRGPVKQLRHWGLVLCDTVPVLKRWITRRGVGFAYPLPKLCCGVPLCP